MKVKINFIILLIAFFLINPLIASKKNKVRIKIGSKELLEILELGNDVKVSIINVGKSYRRLSNYNSPGEFLQTFDEGELNIGKPKILIIGGGLSYDDLVLGNSLVFLQQKEEIGTRENYYPTNAYLVDLEGINYSLNTHSYSDFQANITKALTQRTPNDYKQGINTNLGLPSMFEGKFDIVMWEGLPAMQDQQAFKNVLSLLKSGGLFISDNVTLYPTKFLDKTLLELEFKDIKFINTPNIPEFWYSEKSEKYIIASKL